MNGLNEKQLTIVIFLMIIVPLILIIVQNVVFSGLIDPNFVNDHLIVPASFWIFID